MLGMALGFLALILVLAAGSDDQVSGDRMGRRVELMELIAAEQSRVAALQARIEDLSAQVAAFEATSDEAATIAAVQHEVAEVAAPAGLTAVEGPGLRVVLHDSSQPYDPGKDDPNDLVIHEEDLQGVINALWAGGAEAMSVNGERILATTAIRCVGNTLLLHGRVYTPPYEIDVIGDGSTMRSALKRDPVVARFAAAVDQFSLGYEVTSRRELTIAAYTGLPVLSAAHPGDA